VVAVGQPPGPPECRLDPTADDDRQRPALVGEGTEREVVEHVEAPVERLGRTRPEVAPQRDRLVEVRAAHVEPFVHAEVAVLVVVPAAADPRHDAPSTQRVERGELLGEDDRVALRDDDHARAEPHLVVSGADPGEAEDRLVDAPVLALVARRHRDVVGRPDRRPAEPLGDLGAGLHALTRGAGAEVGKGQPVVHRPNGRC
jgi:hypothetical protein